MVVEGFTVAAEGFTVVEASTAATEVEHLTVGVAATIQVGVAATTATLATMAGGEAIGATLASGMDGELVLALAGDGRHIHTLMGTAPGGVVRTTTLTIIPTTVPIMFPPTTQLPMHILIT